MSNDEEIKRLNSVITKLQIENSALKESLRECVKQAAGWLDECHGVPPDDYGWYITAKNILDS